MSMRYRLKELQEQKSKYISVDLSPGACIKARC